VQIFAVEAGVWLEMEGSVWQGRFGIMCRASCSIHFQFMILYFPFKFLSFSSVYAYTYQYTIWIVLAIWCYLILSRLALSSLVISFLILSVWSYLTSIWSYRMVC
jgi:TctA family transporter